jgi:hypothetical protein
MKEQLDRLDPNPIMTIPEAKEGATTSGDFSMLAAISCVRIGEA